MENGAVEVILPYSIYSLICPLHLYVLVWDFAARKNIHLYVLVLGRRSRPENSLICPGLGEFCTVWRLGRRSRTEMSMKSAREARGDI